MKLIQHRTCSLYCNKQCRAIEGYGESRKWCILGFATNTTKLPLLMKPLEPCPKPMTNDESVEAWENCKFNKFARTAVEKMTTATNPKAIIERIIKPYNAQIVKEDGNTFLVQYPKLGQRSCIADDLEHEFADLRVKIIPSDLLLEVEIL